MVTAKAFEDIHFDVVYSSPLIRAYDTARIITGGKYDIITDDRLKEISFGAEEGVPVEERREDFKNFFLAPQEYVPSEGGESYEQLCARAGAFIEDEIYPQRDTDRNVAVFAHGAMNKALMLKLTNAQICDIWKGEFQKNCCVNIFDITNDSIKLIQEAKIYYKEI
jgi:probable phosphoglycerate mutase